LAWEKLDYYRNIKTNFDLRRNQEKPEQKMSKKSHFLDYIMRG